MRILTPVVAPFNTVVFEGEYESLAAYEEIMAEWRALPAVPAFMAKWHEIVTGEGTNEIWEIAE